MCEQMTQDHKDKLDRAWRYHQNADSLNSGRVNFFIVAESMLVVGYATTSNERFWLRLFLIFLGLLYTLAWWYLCNRLSTRMDYLSKHYLQKLDPIFKEYIESATGPFGKTVLCTILPLGTLLFWVLMLKDLPICGR
jgi:hypothetical protein